MKTSEPLLVESTFPAPIATVWRAISDKDQMKAWYFDLPEFKPEPGFEFQFPGGEGKQTFVHLCKITEVIPERKLAYTWRYEGYVGNSLLTFELFPEGEKTRLKLTHAGLESFPLEEPALEQANFEKGWDHIINTSLKNFLENESV